MNSPTEPKPVEIPGRVFLAISIILFVWNLLTNGNRIDWVALVLFGCAFLPWGSYFFQYIKWGDIEECVTKAEVTNSDFIGDFEDSGWLLVKLTGPRRLPVPAKVERA
jgi:hypothetical protein